MALAKRDGLFNFEFCKISVEKINDVI